MRYIRRSVEMRADDGDHCNGRKMHPPTISEIRMIMLSTQPPKYPARPPRIIIPMMSLMITRGNRTDGHGDPTTVDDTVKNIPTQCVGAAAVQTPCFNVTG